MPVVINKRLGQTDGVYIGRPTVFGNPYEIGRDGNRQEVINKYENWINTNLGLKARAKLELQGKNLVCWCAPLPCHGDVLLKIANEVSF